MAILTNNTIVDLLKHNQLLHPETDVQTSTDDCDLTIKVPKLTQEVSMF